MLRQIRHMAKLARAARVIARHGGLDAALEDPQVPAPAKTALRLIGAGKPRARGEDTGLAKALEELGPSYIKLGQFLATRPDIIGPERSKGLRQLQDRMAPFAMNEAREIIRKGLGRPAGEVFPALSEPVAAASIAQVHKAEVTDEDGKRRQVAVKVLRPDVEVRFRDDLDTFFTAARLAERFSAEARRLRFVKAVETLERSVELEMDLRLEASAMSEMAENTRNDPGFRVPDVFWQETSRRVLTSEWIDGIALTDTEALAASGLDLHRLGDTVIQSFLRHAMRDGFFHADMHQGNLFIDRDNNLVAVDYGIMGRLSIKERRFLAEILWGFIRRDYRRIAEVHFEAGYVPADQDVDLFAQALRAIGEPIMGRSSSDISMGRLLTQLFEVTGQFSMETQPQLILLQKTMVVVEGVARSFNPKLNMWVTAEPVVAEWVEQNLGARARLEEAADGAATLGKLAAAFPEAMSEVSQATHLLSTMARSGGIRLDKETTEQIAQAQSRHSSSTRGALWVGAVALVVLALSQAL
ncbi:MAG: 2-polyprenylphenol 6-hydroxylase [Anderseniella sp.]|nr:2-polyprenylphenol 6-hydroxylase [Anderseniella sp.]